MTRTIREELERWVVEEPTTDGQFRRVPLLVYADRYAAEAVATERRRIAAAVRALFIYSLDVADVYGAVDRAAVLRIIEEQP
jgi:hypothetical protein